MNRNCLLIATIAIANSAVRAEPAAMGAAWFARLRNPETRIEALYEKEKAAAEEDEELKDSEEFSADHQRVLVFPCPQPQFPDAWAVVNLTSWEHSRAILCGPEPGIYAPHPLELERRRVWNAEFPNPPSDFKPWQVGQPWFGSLSGFLVDASGKQLGERFFDPAILADFDSDGMLDLLEVDRLHLKGFVGKDSVMDCISIGPLDSAQSRRAMIFCNLRVSFSSPRTWRFTVRKDDRTRLQLVLVPAAGEQREIAFDFRDGAFVANADTLPDGVLVNSHPKGESYEATRDFLGEHGHSLDGIGSDNASEIDANFPVRIHSPDLSFDSIQISLPETDSLPPREAAQAMVDHQFNPFYRSQYQLASVGDPAPTAKRGWLERWCDGGGWDDESVVIWWLNGNTAERWIQKDTTTFLVSELSASDLGHKIAVTHELDRIRTVPKNPFAPTADHERNSGDDFPFHRVRAMTQSPAALATVFDECIPSFWEWTGPQYDRSLASTLAAIYAKPAQEEGKPRAIRELAPIWLDPKHVADIPPGLCRAAVRSIAANRWTDKKPLLVNLQLFLGPLSADEKRLIEITDETRDWFNRRGQLEGRDEWLAHRKLNALEMEKHDLIVKMTGDLRFELRTPVAEALRDLEETAQE